MFRKKTTGLKAVKPVCLLLLAGACIIACAASVKRPGQAAPDRLSGTVPAVRHRTGGRRSKRGAAFEGGEIRGTDKLVTIYRHDGSVGRSAESQRNYKRPAAPGSSGSSFAGGLTISAKDLGKLLGLLVNDGTYQGLRLLSEESVELMETRFDQILSDGIYQALPLRSQDGIYGRDRLYYHTGSAYGVYNFMSYDPAAGDGIVVLSTGASAARDANGIYAVCGDISRYFYELTAEPS